MKRFLTCFTLLTILFSCKKGGDVETTPDSPINVIPPLPSNANGGVVIASAKRIILYKGDQVSLTADAYDTDGTKLTSSLQWNTTSSAIASATQGTIVAQSLGETVVTASNGTNAQDYITVSVVADTVAIPTGPANIKFSSPGLSIKVGSKAALPSYVLTDYKGNTVTGDPIFEFVNFNKATVDGKSISAGDNTGIGYLMAKVNGIYLNGNLPVTIYNSTSKDTLRSFQVKGQFPSVFNYYNEGSGPVVLQVTESWSNSKGFYLRTYQTNPDKVTVDFPQVISVNDKGEFTSKGPGTTGITLSYKGIDLKMYSGVNVDMSGSWGGSGYSFCINKNLTPVLYDAFNLKSPTDQLIGIRAIFNHTAINPVVSGKANIKNMTTATQFNGCSLLYGPGCSCSLSDLGPFSQSNVIFGQIWVMHDTRFSGTSYNMRWINNLDVIELSNGVRLSRGSGDCTITTDPTLTLSEVLSGNTWIPNECMADEIDPTSFTFNKDGSWKAPDLFFTGEYPISWSCPDNKTIALVGMYFDNYGDYGTSNLRRDTLYVYVSSFTKTAINCSDPRNDWDEDCVHMLNIK